MKLKQQNQKVKIIGAAALTGFSIVACVFGTLCWFNTLKQTDEYNSVTVISPSGFLKQMTVHHYLTIDENNYIFDKNYDSRIYVGSNGELVYEGSSSLTLGVYTPFDKEHPALLLIELTKPVVNYYDAVLDLCVKTESDYLGETNPDGSLVTRLAQTENSMSSVIQFSAKYLSSTTELESHYSTFVEDDSIEFTKSEIGTMDHFVDIAEDGGSYTNYEQRKDVIEFEEDATVQYVAMVIDYYPESMEYIYGLNIGNPVLSNIESNIGFKCDWEVVF